MKHVSAILMPKESQTQSIQQSVGCNLGCNDEHQHQHQQGFSLIELSLVLLIIGIMTAGGLRVFSTAQDQQNYQQTDRALRQIQDALLGHYLQFGRLPCPDTDHQPTSDDYGHEKPKMVTGVCVSNQGWLPHIALGIGGEGDAWGNRYRYAVHPLFSEMPETPLQICHELTRQMSSDNLTIRSAENTSKTLAEWAGFAVLSTGKNGRQTNAGVNPSQGAFASSGGCYLLSEQEQENCDADRILSAGQVLADRQSITFDDRVVWVSDLQIIATIRKTGACF